MTRRSLLVAIGALALLALPTAPTAQTWPARAIRIICSVPAGGTQDAIARTLAQRLTETFGQPVVVENRPGANTIIAAQAAATSPADGYTFLIASDSTLSINPHLYSKLGYDADRDFTPVSLIAQGVEVMFVGSEVQADSVKDFIDYAKANPGKVNYGSFGLGSNAHLAAEKIQQVTGIRMVHVPYKGGADAFRAMQAREVQLIVSGVGSGMPSLKAGKAKVLAVSGSQRHRLLPDVPTFTEAGFPAFDFRAWFGLVAPAGTPQGIVSRVSEEVARFVKSPAFAEKFATASALQAVGSTPAEFADFLKADREKYGQIVRGSNLRLDTP
jgi:tripartite-type tricarboxylate transporter receptor subunit TctC